MRVGLVIIHIKIKEKDMKVCETIQFVNSKFTIYCEVKIFARHFGKILGLLQPFS